VVDRAFIVEGVTRRAFVYEEEDFVPDDPSGGPGDVQPLLVGASPPLDIYCRWVSLSAGTNEGNSALLIAELSRPLGIPSRLPITIGPGTTALEDDYDVDPLLIEFAPGDTTARVVVDTTPAAAQGGTTTVELILDPTGEILIDPSDGPVVLETRPDLLTDTATVLITDDQTGGTPVYRLSVDGSPVTLHEGAGSFGVDIVLDQNAPEDITFSVVGSSIGGDSLAVNGTDYDFNNGEFEPTVIIGEGESRASFTVNPIDNNIPRPTDAEFTVTLELLSGDATAGSPTSFDVTIIDNDADAGAPILSFDFNEEQITEGNTREFRASIVNSVGEPATFGVATDIPITRVFSDPDGNDFTDSLNANPELQFGPDKSSVTFTVTSEIDAETDPGDTVTYTIPVDTGDTYRTPGNAPNTLTISARERVTEINLRATPGIGGTRIVGGLVNIPNQLGGTLPAYKLNGQSMQVVSLEKSGHPQFDSELFYSAYAYGVFTEDGSTPYTSNATTIELDENATGVSPTIAGDFTSYPTVRFEAAYANSGATFRCATDGDSTQITREDWTGSSSARFAQAGPELFEQISRLLRLIDTGAGPSASPTNTTSASGEACGVIDVSVTRFAGDADVFIVEGRWLNGAMRFEDDPYAESEWTDGEVNMIELTVSASQFTVVLPWTHPDEGDVDGSTFSLLNDRGEDYQFRPGDRTGFRFALVRDTAPAEATARAEMYLRYQNCFFAIGPDGSTRNPIQGPEGQYTLDYRDLTNQGSGGPLTGYELVNLIGDQSLADMEGRWTSGSPGIDNLREPRQGWWYPAGSRDGRQGGTSGLWPASGILPTSSFLQRAWFVHERMGQVQYTALRDLSTGEPGWWWDTAQDFGSGFRVPQQSHAGYFRDGLMRPYWCNPPYITDSQLSNPPNDGRSRRNAPTSRPWNNPDVEDTSRAERLDYQNKYASHVSFVRGGWNELWWGARSYNAYRDWEEVAASLTRIYPAALCEDDFDKTARQRFNLEFIWSNMGAESYQTGEIWNTSSNNGSNGRTELSGPRTIVWPMAIIAGFYGIASRETRLGLRGFGPATGKGGDATEGDQLGYMWDLVEWYTSPAGIVGRNTGPNYVPNPFSESDFGPTGDLATRFGAFPDPNSASPATPVTGVGLEFQMTYAVNAVRTMMRKVFNPIDPRQSTIDRLWRYPTNYAEGARVHTSDPRFTVPYTPALGFGQTPRGDFTIPQPADVATEAEMRAGDVYWGQEYLVSYPDVSFGFFLHGVERGWWDAWAAEALNDDSLAENFFSTWSVDDLDDAGRFNHFFRATSPISLNSVEELLTGNTSRIVLYNKYQFVYPALCRLQRRLDP